MTPPPMTTTRARCGSTGSLMPVRVARTGGAATPNPDATDQRVSPRPRLTRRSGLGAPWRQDVSFAGVRAPPDATRSRGSGAVHEGAGGGEELARLEPGLEPGEDHRPAAVDLVVGALAHLVMGDEQAAGVTDRLDLPGDAAGA